MDTLVDAGLVPDTSKWKYPTSPNVRERACRFKTVFVWLLPGLDP